MFKQHRGAVNLAVTSQGKLFAPLPTMLQQTFCMHKGNALGYDNEWQKANKKMNETRPRKSKHRKIKCQPLQQQGCNHIGPVSGIQFVSGVQLL